MSNRTRIGLREIRALHVDQTVWDTTVAGFGARRQKGSAVTYILKYRSANGCRQRWYTIGRHGSPWTPDTARIEAQRLLGEVAKGNDPASDKQARRTAVTVAELCDAYFKDATAGRVLKRSGLAKRASTLAIDSGRIERHIKPLLGAYAVATVTHRDIERFLHDVAEGKTKVRVKTKARGLARVTGGKVAANRSTGLLGAIFTYAVRQGMRTDNPVRGLQRFADGKRDRRLSDEEYQLLERAASSAKDKGIWPPAVAVVRFLAFTGWRKSEALALRWSEVDLARRTASLTDTKTGRSVRPLSQRACGVLREMQTLHPSGSGLVFTATRGEGPMQGFRKFWVRIAKLGDLPCEVTPHVLRHSFASLAGDLGYSDSTIAALVGHSGRSMTSRYVHSADAVLLAAADAVAERIARLMKEEANSPTRASNEVSAQVGELEHVA